MVNLLKALLPVFHGMIRILAGLRRQTVEIEDGTVMSFWIPRKLEKKKPAVVLLHGFTANGILTWMCQVVSLARAKYAVYVPDLLFFGGSVTSSTDRTPAFQARCLIKALTELGVDRCSVVGFSYGGTVAFKMAELQPTLVVSLVITGAVPAVTSSMAATISRSLGFHSFSDLLLPTTREGLRNLFAIAVSPDTKLMLPNCFYTGYLKSLFNYREERSQLLARLVVSDEDTVIPNFPQKILLLWGEDDKFFPLDLAKIIMEQLGGGGNTTLLSVKRGGHLVCFERPFVYNRLLKEHLASCS
ncbi:uncharacterized protein [Aristolochia californica]|uniref:uncharacterized protein n=1 Tax=Aristolochia californica TaxID=171875 RepID=UPI0035D70628